VSRFIRHRQRAQAGTQRREIVLPAFQARPARQRHVRGPPARARTAR
jgi:hypothetical protein